MRQNSSPVSWPSTSMSYLMMRTFGHQRPACAGQVAVVAAIRQEAADPRQREVALDADQHVGAGRKHPDLAVQTSRFKARAVSSSTDVTHRYHRHQHLAVAMTSLNQANSLKSMALAAAEASRIFAR